VSSLDPERKNHPHGVTRGTTQAENASLFRCAALRSQTDVKAVSPCENQSSWTIALRNRKAEDILVTVREPIGRVERAYADAFLLKALGEISLAGSAPTQPSVRLKRCSHTVQEWNSIHGRTCASA